LVKIELQNVSLGYSRKKEVLSGVNFEVKPGELVGLIGPNGCGKSTIIRTITRVIPPLRGRIVLDGADISTISQQQLALRIGVVPQMPLLPSAFTAFEIVLMGRNPHMGLLQHEHQQELDITWDAMGKTMTQHLAARRVGELSGGEIQSLLIARVLVQQTQAILLDEPTANLDIGRQVEMLGLIKSLCREQHLAVLAALHDLNLAAQYCDRLILISNGCICSQGLPAEVITPGNIRTVYGAERCVYPHPVNGLPTVLPIANGWHNTQNTG